VSIGFPGVLEPLLGFELFTRVKTMYPQIQLHVGDANSWLLRERLVNGRLDIALLYLARSERGLAVEPLLQEEMFYVSADPDSSPIRLAEAAERPLIMPGIGSSSWAVANEAFKKHGFAITPVAEIDALRTLRRAIAAGIGDSILPWCAIDGAQWKYKLNYRPFADARLVRPIALCFSDVAQRNPAIEAVASTLKSLIQELVENGSWQGVSPIASSAELAHSLAPQ
jgi:LysR family transcriptional regulator, nitrogen assimilation regulatory protein